MAEGIGSKFVNHEKRGASIGLAKIGQLLATFCKSFAQSPFESRADIKQSPDSRLRVSQLGQAMANRGLPFPLQPQHHRYDIVGMELFQQPLEVPQGEMIIAEKKH